MHVEHAIPVIDGKPKCALMRYSLLPEYCFMLQMIASLSGKYVTVPAKHRDQVDEDERDNR